MPFRFKSFLKGALQLLSALFFLFLLNSCEKKKARTTTWVSSAAQQKVAEETEKAPSAIPAPNDDPLPAAVRFMAYNAYNYLTMQRGKQAAPKPESEIEALIKIILSEKPDILGLCEIGTSDDLADLQARLKTAGLHLSHSEHAHGTDGTRGLGLLSRFPIVNTDSQSNLTYQLNGTTWGLRRGLLDATIDIGGRELRLVGCHLKSKREIEEADQELVRQNEAILVREHASAIMAANPDQLLIVYGDFNDTIKTKTLSIMKGHHGAKNYLPDYYFIDSRGELWTHFWNYQDIYSRFDYMLHSQALTKHIDGKNSYIVDHPDWRAASDHRALLISIR